MLCGVVPGDSAWLATAARTCKAWLEPALRHLYRTIFLDACDLTEEDELFIVTADMVARIGYRVRNLCLGDERELSEDTCRLISAFCHFIHLAIAQPRAQEDPHMSAILSCPSLPNLTDLEVQFLTSPPTFPPPTILKACRNLRRLRFNPISGLPDQPLEVAAPEKLEDLTIYRGYMHKALAPLFTCCTRLVALNLCLLRRIDYGLVDRVIRASSQSLRAFSLYTFDDSIDDSDDTNGGRLVLRALPTCTSLRFLQLGRPMVGCMELRKVFELLAPLPIEFLSVMSPLPSSDELIDSLLLLPSVLAIHAYYRNEDLQLIRSKLKDVEFEAYPSISGGDWPRPFHRLAPRIQEIFRYRSYRTLVARPLLRYHLHVH
jgi:hypothetical protein